MSKDKKLEVKVIAELEVVSPEGKETIKTFDKAWHRALQLPVPVNINFIRFGRAD